MNVADTAMRLTLAIVNEGSQHFHEIRNLAEETITDLSARGTVSDENIELLTRHRIGGRLGTLMLEKMT